MCCNTKCWLIAGSVIGGLLAILGGILIPVGDIVIKGEIDKEAVIEEGTIAYDNWIVPGSSVYRQFWIYQVLNPDDIINGGKPKLQQKGPYTYLVRYAPKYNVTQNNNNTVTFYQPNVAAFQRDMSIGPDSDTYTVLNLAVAAAPGMISNVFLSIVNQAIKSSNSSLFQTRSVKEVLWGYRDPFLEQIPDFIIKDKMTGVFYPYNETNDGPYVVYNGKDDISKVAKITRYNRESTLSYWNDDYCDMINGTDAASFPPFVDKNAPLYFFSSEICRSIYAVFEKEYTLEGIKLSRFVLPKFALASPYDNPDNHCFCKDQLISRNCNASGVLDLRACQGGKPIFLSLPHFLYASEFLLESLDGLSPNVEEHQTYVDVEPTTGFTMHFAKRLQVNVYFNRTSKIDVLSNLLSEFMFPVVWLNETATIGKDKANEFKSSVTTPMNALGIIQIVFICLGIVLFLSCSITLCVRSRKERRNGKKV
ncbi:platelet glycoprotein 4 [Hyla sarda]|uniref:platelet glycoprotein 4 n=1 Tax=Hyla sarda TaxID=327740 RepID=UPI0024C383FB|nr:platelet glycoprotein 4 [Hyla sarda]